MRFMFHYSIKQKITTIAILSSSLALIVASIIFVIADQVSTRNDMVEELKVLANILSFNSIAAITFNNNEDATEVLSSLKAEHQIISAHITTPEGKEIAAYHRDKHTLSDNYKCIPNTQEYVFSSNYLDLTQTIFLNKKPIGRIYLKHDLSELTDHMSQYMTISAIAFAFVALMTFLVVGKFQKIISGPIGHLANTARQVFEKQDYSIRAIIFADDETGFLTEKFNEMLADIQQRDTEIHDAHDGLERRVKERTSELENEITERIRTEQEKRNRLNRIQRQRLAITQLTTNENIVGGDFSLAVKALTEIIAETTEVNRVSIWLYNKEQTQIECIDLFEVEEKQHSQGATLKASDFPRYFEALGKERIISANNAITDDRTSEFTKLYLEPLCITSMLDSAIRVGGNTIGVVCQENIGKERVWMSDEITFADEVASHTAQAFAIAEQRQAEEQRKDLEDKLDRAERMESLGILAGGVAHDLNNMLGPIVGYSELLLMQMDEKDQKNKKKVERIGRSAKDAADVIQDLLTLARRGRYEMELTDLNQVIADYMETPGFLKLIDDNPDVNVRINIDHSIGKMMGSATHLSKMIMNLVVNAFDAVQKDGNISITTSEQYLDKLKNGHKLEQYAGDFIALTIADNGNGIEPESLDKIFEPYFSKKKMGHSSGSGLGLSVVYGVLKDHKGYYDIISSPNNGTEFKFFLPISTVTETAKKITKGLNVEGNERILIVDDDCGQREIATELLRNLGYSTHSVSSGEMAIEYLQNNTVDLIVLDMIMDPGIDGLDTYRKILKLYPNQKAVIASGYSATDRVEEMQKLGAGQYIKKPYSIATIGEVIRTELDRSSEPTHITYS